MSETTTVDWRALPAGRELDRIVAARLGFSVVQLPPRDASKRPKAYVTWEYKQPGWVIKGEGLHKNLWDVRFREEWEAWDHCPEYSQDANAALALWDVDYRWAVYPAYPDDYDKGRFCATFPGHGDQDAGDEYADTPALAIVQAWLAWKDRQRE